MDQGETGNYEIESHAKTTLVGSSQTAQHLGPKFTKRGGQGKRGGPENRELRSASEGVPSGHREEYNARRGIPAGALLLVIEVTGDRACKKAVQEDGLVLNSGTGPDVIF